MKFSVATPVRNALPGLRRCVGSVRGQRGMEVEHLVQDACSTDGTRTWLERQADLNWRCERDAGMYDAINRAWGRASGDILSWLNADEQYLPGALVAMADAFARHPGADVLFADTIIVDAEGDPLAARREIPLRNWYLRHGFLYALSCTLFFRRRLLAEGVLRFDTSYRFAGDYDLMLRLLDAGCRVVHLRRYVALFGVDGRNLSLNPAMEREGDEIRARRGVRGTGPAALASKAARRVERLLTGCYRRDDLDYDMALNETPEYRHVRAARVSPLFTYDAFREGACDVR